MICFLHPRYHSKVIGNILKNIKKQVFLFKRGYMINDNENEAEIKNRSHWYDIRRPRAGHGHKYLNAKCVSV